MGSVSILTLLLFLYLLIFRPKTKLTGYFIATIGCILIWCIGYFFQLCSTDIPTMMFWVRIQWVGIFMFAPFHLYFFLVFTDRAEVTTKPALRLIFLPFLINFLFLLTNDVHELFYASIGIQSSQYGATLDVTYGPLFYLNAIYTYLLLGIGYAFLIHAYISASRTKLLYRKQLQILIFAGPIPLLGNIIRILGLFPALDLDLTSILSVICYILFALALQLDEILSKMLHIDLRDEEVIEYALKVKKMVNVMDDTN